MKKCMITLLLACVLACLSTITVLADGNIPIGGRSCDPSQQTCSFANQISTPDKTVKTGIPEKTDKTVQGGIFKSFWDYISTIFG